MTDSPKIHWHFYNPWRDKLVYVRLTDLLKLLPAGYSGYVANYGRRLDAYLLPQPNGLFSVGIRYGSEPHEYLSPYVDPDKAAQLLSIDSCKHNNKFSIHIMHERMKEEEEEVLKAAAEKFERELAEYQQKLNKRFGIGTGKLTPIDEPSS